MDYPKSVPGVGLVGGKFVDENTATGQQGSLIPAAWGNSVTEELLNLIRAAGAEPNEALEDQIARILWTDPTESKRGMPLVATPAEALAKASTSKMLTPSNLKSALPGSRGGGPGRVFEEAFASGLKMQAFEGAISPGLTDVSMPVAFPSRTVAVLAFDMVYGAAAGGGVQTPAYDPENTTKSKIRFLLPAGQPSGAVMIFAFGE